MMKSVLKYILPLVFLLAGCAKETEAPVPAPRMKTVHYRASVEADPGTRATVDENMKYVFQAGDRIYLESEGGELYGFLSLSQESDAGKTLAFFEGNLTCAEDFSPLADTQVTLVLVGPDDKIHKVSEEGKLTDPAYTDYQVSSLEEAVRCLSHFTASGTFGALRFTLSQQSSFVVFSFQFDEESVDPGTSYSLKLFNNGAEEPILSCPFATEAVEDGVEASCVAAFPGGTKLTGAKVVLRKAGEEEDGLVLNMSDNTLEASSYYTFQRATFMQNYLTVEAISGSTKVTFNKASGNSVQYSLDGYDWKNYTSAVTLASKGDKIYFRGKGTTYQQTGDSGLFAVDKASYVYGDLMFLMCNDKYKAKKEIEADFAFQRAFYKASWLRLSEEPGKKLILSATTMRKGCYFEMFRECTGITKLDNLVLGDAPLTERCFDSMFLNCSGITSIPEGFLPWTQLAFACYRKMFEGCSKLATIPSDLLPALTLAKACYTRMFFNCTSLEVAPELPATEPKPACYFAIFRNCTKIKYVKCLMFLDSDQRTGYANPDTSVYNNDADPPADNLKNWEIISMWTVFNKWLVTTNNQPLNNKSTSVFVKNPGMEYWRKNNPPGYSSVNWMGVVPSEWQMLDADLNN